MSNDKTYTGTIKFGESTDSYDADGALTGSLPVPPLTVAELNQLVQTFTGDLMQTPPMVSAVKQAGVPLYKLARRGVEVVREPRLIHVYQFSFSDYQEPVGFFSIACTKGTYVRSLAHELGQKIGCGAHLSTLRRTRSGQLQVDQALPFEHALSMDAGELPRHIVPFRELLLLAKS
jgi:tRNA pseudouridine55 synthase